jgi:plasmid stabilization system protein ParE
MADRRRRVVWTEQARSALDEILTYIAQNSAQAARGVLEEALGTAEGLATLSDRGRIVPELEDPSIREVFIGKYRLLYEVSPTEVSILAILHGARDFAKWQEED